MWFRLVLSALAVLALPGLPHPAGATDLIVLDREVPVYSGPGVRFRRIQLAPPRSKLKAQSKTVRRGSEEYFVVEIEDATGTKRAGFVQVQAPVERIDSSVSEDEIERFGSIALVDRAIQFAYSSLQDGRSLQTLAFLSYLSPGFYTKAFAGQFLATPGNGLTLGFEVGNDSILFDRFSGVVSVGVGGFWPNQAGLVFEASSTTNAIALASFGLRYNAFGLASFSLLGTQTALFNANNSLVVSGLGLTIEVGL